MRGHRDAPARTPARSVCVQGILLAAALTGVFLAGTARQGASGIFLAAAGTAMILLPPTGRVPWRLWAGGGFLIAWALFAFLPQAWLPVPAWREALAKEPGLPTLAQISLTPRESGYWILLLAAAVVAGLYSLGHVLRSGALRPLVSLASLGCAAYALTAIHARTTGWEYPFFDKGGWSPPDFGFFPNRNHTAGFLVTGSILGVALVRDAWTRRSVVGFAAGGFAAATCVYALLAHSMSRAGVVFLVLGCLVWILGLGRSHRSRPLLVSALAVSAALGAFFFVTDGPARDRLLETFGLRNPAAENAVHPGGPAFPVPEGDLRFRIFEDTLRIVRDYPLTGTGIGTFAHVFPFYLKSSIDEAVPIHPESDWLMLAAETGLPSLLCVGFLLGMLVCGMRVALDSPGWGLRWGVACAALTAMAHGLVDVPLHRVELGWWILVLAGWGFGVPVANGEGSGVQRIVLGMAGAAMLGVGVLLVRAQWFGESPLPPFRAKVAVEQIRQLAAAGREGEAVDLARSEIPLSPMERGLYRELGYREIRNGGNPVVADTVFAAERALNPASAKIPYDQGVLWMGDDPSRTALLWVEALQKNVRLAEAGGYAKPVEFYEGLLSQSRSHPGLKDALKQAARRIPPLRPAVLSEASPDEIAQALADPAIRASLDPERRTRLLNDWWTKGARDKLWRFLEENPDLEDQAFPVRVRDLIDRKMHREAVEAVASKNGISLADPDRSAPVVLEFESLNERKNPVAARRIAQEAAQAGDPAARHLLILLALRENDAPRAWSELQAYLRLQGTPLR